MSVMCHLSFYLQHIAQCWVTLIAEWRQQLPLTFVMGASMVMEWILAIDG